MDSKSLLVTKRNPTNVRHGTTSAPPRFIGERCDWPAMSTSRRPLACLACQSGGCCGTVAPRRGTSSEKYPSGQKLMLLFTKTSGTHMKVCRVFVNITHILAPRTVFKGQHWTLYCTLSFEKRCQTKRSIMDAPLPHTGLHIPVAYPNAGFFNVFFFFFTNTVFYNTVRWATAFHSKYLNVDVCVKVTHEVKVFLTEMI